MGFLRRLFGGTPTSTAREYEALLMDPARDDAVVEVVGESNYQPALMLAAGGRTPGGVVKSEHLAALVREPRNRYDRNAVRIDIEGNTVGYLSRDTAIAYRAVIDSVNATGKLFACHARLIGGWDRGGGDVGSIGVILHLGTPSECMLELMDLPAPRLDHRWAGHVIAFTGDSTCRVGGFALDRPASIALAERAGLLVLPRVTKKVQLLVDCDRTGASGNELKAREYGIEIVDEPTFWGELGVPVERLTWGATRH